MKREHRKEEIALGDADRHLLAETCAKCGWKVHAAWSFRGVDANLERLVILDTLPVVRSSEEGEALRWMLNALDNLEKERAECIRLAKGNSLEKSLAVKRLELLDGNPRLRSAMR